MSTDMSRKKKTDEKWGHLGENNSQFHYVGNVSENLGKLRNMNFGI